MPIKEYLEPKDASLIEDAALSLRDKLLIRILRTVGCRIGELLGIEERHIDFKNRQIRIEHEKIRVKRTCPFCAAQGIETRLGKKSKFCPQCSQPVQQFIQKEKPEKHLRKVPVDKDTLELIKEYIKRGGVTVVEGKRMLFNISRQRAYIIVRECANRAGFLTIENAENEKIHHVSPHKFRDALAIEIMKKRPTFDDARILQELLGHKRIDTTMRYRKVAIGELQDFMDDVRKESQ